MKLPKLPDIQKKVLKNWAKLFTGSTLGSALGFLATILMTRAIGLVDVGIFSVIQTFWRTLEGFLSFQSFQVVIKYGADFMLTKNMDSMRILLKVCLLADLTMATTGAALGLTGFYLLHSGMNVPDAVAPIGFFGAVTMLTMVTGAHSGVLRLFDMFNVLAFRDVVVGVMRVFFNALAFFMSLPLHAFIAIWIITEAMGNLMIIFYGFRELRKRGITNIFRAKLSNEPLVRPAKIVKSLATINFTTMIRVTTDEGDTLLVNHFLGPAAAGIYRIAKNLTNISYKFTAPLIQSVYPEIAKLVSKKDRGGFKNLLLHTCLQGGGFGLCVWFGWFILGEEVLRWTVGAEYTSALPIILIISGGYAFGFFGIGFNSSLYAFDKLNQYLFTGIMSTAMFFVVAIPLFSITGITAAAWGQVACYGTGLLINIFIVLRAYKAHPWE